VIQKNWTKRQHLFIS